MTELLESIYQIGEQMRTALSENDLECFYGLLSKRQQAIQQFSNQSEINSSSPELSEKFAILEKQFKLIMNDLKIKEQSMIKDLQQLQNLKQAQRSYGFDRQPHRFLRNNVAG